MNEPHQVYEPSDGFEITRTNEDIAKEASYVILNYKNRASYKGIINKDTEALITYIKLLEAEISDHA